MCRCDSRQDGISHIIGQVECGVGRNRAVAQRRGHRVLNAEPGEGFATSRPRFCAMLLDQSDDELLTASVIGRYESPTAGHAVMADLHVRVALVAGEQPAEFGNEPVRDVEDADRR